MNWFKKSSPESAASRRSQDSDAQDLEQPLRKRAKKSKKPKTGTEKEKEATSVASASADMAKSLSALQEQLIEVVDPEDFFQDPEHVRNYRDEAKFLRLMSEWEIVELPASVGSGNYFSADFEEELLHMKTQDQSHAPPMRHADSCGSLDSSRDWAEDAAADSAEQQRPSQRGRGKRRLCDLLFGDAIQTGIALPKRPRRQGKSKKSLSSLASAEDLQGGEEGEETAAVVSCLVASPPNALASACRRRLVKDGRIDRSLLKTEALACSIMGAIGRCPGRDRDGTPHSSVSDLDAVGTGAGGGGGRSYRCDHYDIKQFFRLDDNGNILLNMNHIEECRGFGFAVAQSKRLYRRCRREGRSAEEDASYCRRRGCLQAVKRLLRLLWTFMAGHPRNKINPYGAGPGDSVRAYTLQLAQDQSSTFARNIENFISCTKESREAAPQVVMRNMRQFMNGMKNYLVKHGEGKFQQEVESARSRLKSDEFLNLDAILETVMHQLVVLPLREHLYGMFVDYYTRSEDIQLLAQNVKYACGRSAADFGIRATVTPPTPNSLHVISNLLLRLQEAELPLEKLDLFLCVISTIFDATGCPRGQQLGADDFLPILVYVVAKCGFVGAEIEAEFMWGLLQPTLLNGEPGYYLTALCSAVHVLKSFMASENESGTGSLDWRASSLPACSSVLRVIIPDECNGSLQTRTLPVRPHTTTREVCRIIAHKARITNPQDYALFKLVDGEETPLSETECPQDIRLATKGKHCMLAYKRIDAKIAWPTSTHPVYH